MSRTLMLCLTLAMTLAMTLAAGIAEAKQWRYAGLHPRTGHPKGGLCYLTAPHVHAVAPARAELLYREHQGAYVFIGDPTPFGYDGDRHAFYGHHPVVLSVVIGRPGAREEPESYCYHDGPHYHAYAPPEAFDFDEEEDVAYFVGDYPEVYVTERPRRDPVDVVYATWSAPRPVVVAPPPTRYRGPIVEVNVVMPAIGIEVVPPHPGVIVVGGPPGHHKHHFKKHKKHKRGKWKGRD